MSWCPDFEFRGIYRPALGSVAGPFCLRVRQHGYMRSSPFQTMHTRTPHTTHNNTNVCADIHVYTAVHGPSGEKSHLGQLELGLTVSLL